MGIRWDEKIKNKPVKETTGGEEIKYTTKKLKINHAGPVARKKEEKWGEITLNLILRYTKQSKERRQQDGKTKLERKWDPCGKGRLKIEPSGMWMRRHKPSGGQL